MGEQHDSKIGRKGRDLIDAALSEAQPVSDSPLWTAPIEPRLDELMAKLDRSAGPIASEAPVEMNA
jgi:hypothetical protein